MSSDAVSHQIPAADFNGVPACAPVVNKPVQKFTTQKFVRDVVYSNLPVPFQKLRTYLWLVVMTRALGAEGFGAWSLFILALSNTTTVATLNCGSSLMRFLSGRRTTAEVNQAFSTVLSMVGTATAVAILLFLLFSKGMSTILFHSRQSAILILMLAIALPIDCAFEEMKNLLRARRLNKSWALLSLSRLLPETGATLVVAWWLRGVPTVSCTYIVVGVCSVIGGLIFLVRRCGISAVRPSSRIAFKYAAFGLPLLPGVVASAISLGADKYLVGYYLGLRDVGIYSVCFTVSALTFFLIGPINDVLFPELSALYDRNQAELFRQRFSGIQRFVFGVSVGASAILAAFPREVLRVLASRSFISGSTTLTILGAQGIFMAIVMLYAVILNVRMRVWCSTVFWMASGALIVILDFSLIPRIGIVGAAYSQLIVTAAGAIVLLGMHWDLFRSTFATSWLLQSGVAFASVALLAVVLPGGWGNAGIAVLRIAAGGSAFLFCLFVTGFFRLSDLRLMKAAIV